MKYIFVYYFFYLIIWRLIFYVNMYTLYTGLVLEYLFLLYYYYVNNINVVLHVFKKNICDWNLFSV